MADKLYFLLMSFSLLLFTNCSSDEGGICDTASSIDVGFGSCLIFEKGEELDEYKKVIEDRFIEGLIRINSFIPIEGLEFTVRHSPIDVIPEIGIGGFNHNENQISIYLDTAFSELANSLQVELGPMIAHEVHHAKRRRFVGYGSTLLEAMISEGLADHFSVEAYNISPPIWSLALSGSQIADWKSQAKLTWNDRPYDHGKWFRGTTQDVPRWAGYAIGYQMVKDYLDKNPLRSASDLFDENAQSFVQ